MYAVINYLTKIYPIKLFSKLFNQKNYKNVFNLLFLTLLESKRNQKSDLICFCFNFFHTKIRGPKFVTTGMLLF